VWSAFLQAMTDSSWYSPVHPPGRAVLVLRPVMPLIVATILFAILAYPIYREHQAVPGGLFGDLIGARAGLAIPGGPLTVAVASGRGTVLDSGAALGSGAALRHGHDGRGRSHRGAGRH